LKDALDRKGKTMRKSLKPGDSLENRISGERVAVINDDGETVSLLPMHSTITYPSDKIWRHFKKVRKTTTTA